MSEIVVIGGGGHAKVLISVLRKLPAFKIIGYLDPKNAGKILGVLRLGDDRMWREIKSQYPNCCAALGVGAASINLSRQQLIEKLEKSGFSLPAIVSPRAVVNEDVILGGAAMVFDGAVIQPGARIGRGVIINTRASVDHDCDIRDYVHVAPGAVLGGGVIVGEHAFIGLGASVAPYRKIGERCLIGAGATVVDDCLEPGTYVGTPARKIK